MWVTYKLAMAFLSFNGTKCRQKMNGKYFKNFGSQFCHWRIRSFSNLLAHKWFEKQVYCNFITIRFWFLLRLLFLRGFYLFIYDFFPKRIEISRMVSVGLCLIQIIFRCINDFFLFLSSKWDANHFFSVQFLYVDVEQEKSRLENIFS